MTLLRKAKSFRPRTNISVAAFTTFQSRLLLFEYLYTLRTRALYHDTDSVFHVSDLDRADCEMTYELTDYGPGTHIVSLVSGGPKLYAYKVKKPDASFGYT